MTRMARIFCLIVGDGGEADQVSWIIGLSQMVVKAVVFCLLRLFFFFFGTTGIRGENGE